MQGPIVSVSGVRGVSGVSFTPALVRSYVKAAAAMWQQEGERTLVLARDPRLSGEWAYRLVGALLQEAGFRLLSLGVAPTPTAQMIAKHFNAGGGIVITGSHNPPAWNALKFLGKEGIFWSPVRMHWLEELAEQGVEPEVRGGGLRREVPQAGKLHLRYVLRAVDAALIRSRRWRVVVDAGNGAGALVLPELLRGLGCDVEVMHGELDGSFRRLPEPAAENLEALRARVAEGKFDLGFACDADADRLAVVCRGGTASEEVTLPLAVEAVLGRAGDRFWQGKKLCRFVVANLSTSGLVEEVARRYKARVVRTPVGERHVVEGIMVHRAVIGGEGNGGVIYPSLHLGRDALAAAALVLEALARLRCNLQDWLASYPPFYVHKEKCLLEGEFTGVVEMLREVLPPGREDWTDGWRAEWSWGWLHLRLSRTEPLLRVILETREEGRMRALRRVLKLVLREHTVARMQRGA